MCQVPIFILTLDLEADHGLYEQRHYEALKYLESLMELLVQYNVPLTVFATGKILKDYPITIKKLIDNKIDVQLHSYNHNFSRAISLQEELGLSKKNYKILISADPIGYRPPYGRMEKKHLNLLRYNDFKYTSSSLPCSTKEIISAFGLTYYYENGVYDFPVTRLPGIGIPMGLSWMNFVGRKLFQKLYKPILRKKMSVIFYLHLHDICNTDAYYELPLRWKIFYVRNRISSHGYKNLETVIKDFQEGGYRFCNMLNLYNLIHRD